MQNRAHSGQQTPEEMGLDLNCETHCQPMTQPLEIAEHKNLFNSKCNFYMILGKAEEITISSLISESPYVPIY